MEDKVKEQILAVRDTGLTNMFDTNTVQRIAHEMAFFELVLFLEEHKNKYVRFILTGKEYRCKLHSFYSNNSLKIRVVYARIYRIIDLI